MSKAESLSRSPLQFSEWGSDNWGSTGQYQTLHSPPASTYNAYPTSGVNYSDDTWADTSIDLSYSRAPANSAETSHLGERLHALKDKVIHGMGRKALDTVMNRLPTLGGHKETLQSVATNLHENPDQASAAYQGATELWGNRGSYAEQAVGYAKQAGREVAGAGISAAKESVMKYYGLEKDENEKLRVARKIKFGKAVVKTVVNPIGTASSVGTRAGYAARKASVKSAKGHITSSAEVARNWQPKPVAATPDIWANDW